MMHQVSDEIKLHFASKMQGLRQITNLVSPYGAFTFRSNVEYGVAIENVLSKDIYEESAQISIKTFVFNGKTYIALSCCDEQFRNEFAEFATSFVIPGTNGYNRQTILSKPLDWWNGWVGMLGNRISSSNCYDILAELMALYDLYQNDHTIQWTASQNGSHDIESSTRSYEIKSTLKKSETMITISSQYQLFSNTPLQLWFYRMEPSDQGESINDLAKKLINVGYNAALIESQLDKRGFTKGKSVRDKKYFLLERRRYDVNQSFPKIVASSFVNNVYPSNIVKILYTIDLQGLPYK